MRLGQGSVDHVGVAKLGGPDLGEPKIGLGQVSPFQVGVGQVSRIEIGMAQLRPPQDGPPEDRVCERGLVHAGRFHLATREGGPVQVGVDELRSVEVRV